MASVIRIDVTLLEARAGDQRIRQLKPALSNTVNKNITKHCDLLSRSAMAFKIKTAIHLCVYANKRL